MDKDSLPNRLDALEQRLRAIAPRDVSSAAMQRCDETIDALADGAAGKRTGTAGEQAARSALRPWAWASAAAVVVGAAVWLPALWDADDAPALAAGHDPSSGTGAPGFVLLKSTNRVDGHEDDGLIIPTDGSAPHYRHRYHIVDEEQVRDEKTGTVVTLRQPRQEVIRVPVTQF